MTTLATTIHADRAHLYASLAPGDAVPDTIHVSVSLAGVNLYTGSIHVYYWGRHKATGERHKRRSSCWWAFDKDSVALFSEPDVRALLRARRPR